MGVTRLLAAVGHRPGHHRPDGIRDRTVAWDAGRLDADPRRVVVVSWTGANPEADPSDPCWVGYAPEVSAEPDRVVVTIRTYRSRVPLGPQQSCTDLGFIRTLAVPLHNELGGRTVVDGHSGRRHRLAPVPLEPRWLPPGRPWRHRRGRALPGRPGHGRPLAGGPPRAGRGRQLPDRPSGRAVAAVRDLLVRIAKGLE